MNEEQFETMKQALNLLTEGFKELVNKSKQQAETIEKQSDTIHLLQKQMNGLSRRIACLERGYGACE